MPTTDTSIPFWQPVGAQDGPTYQQNAWDTLFVGDKQMPGFVEVEALPSKDIDRKKGKGSSGESATVHGYRAAKITVRVHIWTPGQWSVFLPILAALWPRPGKDAPPSGPPSPVLSPFLAGPSTSPTPTAITGSAPAGQPQKQAFEARHPELAALGIKALIVETVSTSRRGGASGIKIWQFGCIEFLPSISTGVTTPKKADTSTEAVDPKLQSPTQKNTPPSPPPGTSPSAYTPANANYSAPSGDTKFIGP